MSDALTGSADELVIGAGADAVPVARRFTRSALAGHELMRFDAELVVTELVTNAVLHGRPPVTLRILASEPTVRVEVIDTSSDLPVVPLGSTQGMTGRGLALVAAVSQRWGVEQRPGGKTVWAELSAGQAEAGQEPARTDVPVPRDEVDAFLDAWPDEDDDAEPTFTIRLPAVPTDLLIAAKSDLDNIIRELTLASSDESAERPPPALQSLLDAVTGEWASARLAIKQQAIAASQRGEAETELVLRQPASAADAGERYLAALDAADRYARAARLLSLEPAPVHRLFRRWYVQSLVEQLRAHAEGRTPPQVRSFVEVLAHELDATEELRESVERLQLLQTLTADLTSAAGVADIARTVLERSRDYLRVVTGRVFLVDGDVLRGLWSVTEDPAWQPGFDVVPLEPGMPGPDAILTGQALLMHNRAEIERRYPALRGVYKQDCGLQVAPLIVGEHRMGILAFSFPAVSELAAATRARFVTAIADVLAQALERALAMEAAAAANARLEFLADASVSLSASLDYDATLEAVTRIMVPRLADWCVVQMLSGDTLTTAALLHFDPAKVAWARSMEGRYPTQMDSPTGAPNVLRTGVSEIYPDITDDMVQAAAVDDEHLEIIRNLGMRSALVVPLTGRSGTVGAVTLIYAESGRHYSDEDVSFAEDVCRRAALALETASTLREQSGRLADVTRIAEAAQRAILSPPPEQVGPVALRARYVSAAAEAQIGGDLYEVVTRPGAVRLLIGDVRGKGLAAVRTATIVLGEFRASAADQADLRRVARQIDRRLRPYLGDEDFVTALLAEVHEDGSFAIANCGHPPALLGHAGGVRELASEHTTPLGLGAAPELMTGRLELGDRLLLYTDGAIEARDSGGRFVDLLALTGSLVGSPLDDVLDGILATLRETVGGELGDDLALLVAEFTGAAAVAGDPMDG